MGTEPGMAPWYGATWPPRNVALKTQNTLTTAGHRDKMGQIHHSSLETHVDTF